VFPIIFATQHLEPSIYEPSTNIKEKEIFSELWSTQFKTRFSGIITLKEAVKMQQTMNLRNRTGWHVIKHQVHGRWDVEKEEEFKLAKDLREVGRNCRML